MLWICSLGTAFADINAKLSFFWFLCLFVLGNIKNLESACGYWKEAESDTKGFIDWSHVTASAWSACWNLVSFTTTCTCLSFIPLLRCKEGYQGVRCDQFLPKTDSILSDPSRSSLFLLCNVMMYRYSYLSWRSYCIPLSLKAVKDRGCKWWRWTWSKHSQG